MTARARNTDPETSHEAAAQVATKPSQQLVYALAGTRLKGRPFTDKDLVRAVREDWSARQYTDSRIRTARRELADKRLVEHVGYTTPTTGRRERLWQVAR